MRTESILDRFPRRLSLRWTSEARSLKYFLNREGTLYRRLHKYFCTMCWREIFYSEIPRIVISRGIQVSIYLPIMERSSFFEVLTTCESESACSLPEISGTIPPELGKLCSLEGLDLSWNKLHGKWARGAGRQQKKDVSS